MFLKATVRPDLKPDDVDPSDKKQIVDENAWVYEAYFKLRDALEAAIAPLELYIRTYDKYDKEYKLDPAAVVKKLDDEDNPPEIEFLKKDVIFHQEEAERLKSEIPDFIIVSCFKVSCREIRATLA
jgi:dynein heavy chain